MQKLSSSSLFKAAATHTSNHSSLLLKSLPSSLNSSTNGLVAKLTRSSTNSNNTNVRSFSLLTSNRNNNDRASVISARQHARPFQSDRAASVASSDRSHLCSTVAATLNAIPEFPCEKSAIERMARARTGTTQEQSFFVNDIGIVQRQYNRWVKNLPRVRPFYAVKCNPDETLLRVLAQCGTGFDCASGEEMRAVLKLGARPEEVIFANPIKNAKDLRYAASMGVKKMTFDNIDELYKIKEHHPNCELVLRLLADDSGSVMKFGTKFGAPQQHVEKLLTTAHKLGLKVIGTSFHIGSGCFDANSYEKAIALSRSVFDKCESLGLPKMTFLDLGGGFPGNPNENEATGDTPAFETFASVIRTSLDKYFPEGCGVQVIGEPGRYMATAWSTLFTLVQGKREVPVAASESDDGSIKRKFLYYINDGVYGSFNCIMFDHAEPQPIPAYRFMKNKLTAEEAANAARVTMTPKSSGNHHSIWSSLSQYEPETMSGAKQFARAMSTEAERDAHTLATFFGPTCDSMDVIAKDVVMEELFVGDWVAFEQMGAYTGAAASTFNGMAKPTIHFVRSKQPSPIVA